MKQFGGRVRQRQTGAGEQGGQRPDNREFHGGSCRWEGCGRRGPGPPVVPPARERPAGADPLPATPLGDVSAVRAGRLYIQPDCRRYPTKQHGPPVAPTARPFAPLSSFTPPTLVAIQE